MDTKKSCFLDPDPAECKLVREEPKTKALFFKEIITKIDMEKRRQLAKYLGADCTGCSPCKIYS